MTRTQAEILKEYIAQVAKDTYWEIKDGDSPQRGMHPTGRWEPVVTTLWEEFIMHCEPESDGD